jgi:hypothetical protein
LDALLGLDGEVFVVDAMGHWVRFVAKAVQVSNEQPHGVSYSLTLHDVSGAQRARATQKERADPTD